MPSTALRHEHAGAGRRVEHGDLPGAAVDRHRAGADADRVVDLGQRVDGVDDPGAQPTTAELAGGDDQVAVDDRADVVVDGGLQRPGEDGEHGDDADADHQRRRRRRRAPGGAHGVATGEGAGDAAQAGDRCADHGTGGTGRDRAEGDDATRR